MSLHYLEIVTDQVEKTCATYERLHGLSFGKADAVLGGARVASMPGGGEIGIRGPLSDVETPVVRPYTLVEDINEATQAIVDSGGEIALEPTELPGHGKIAIFIQGGIQHGIWQL